MAAVWRWLLSISCLCLIYLYLLPQLFLDSFSIVEYKGNVTYHLGDHACSSAVGYTLRLLTEFIAFGTMMIAIHCVAALVVKTRKLRMTVNELTKLQQDMRTSKTSADSWKLLYEEMKESFGQIKEEAASKAEEYQRTTEAECVRNTTKFEVMKGELVTATNICNKKEERLVAMTIKCELREETAAMAVRELEAMAAKSERKEEELAAMVQLCQEKEAALQQKVAQEEAQQLLMEEYRKRICVLKTEMEGSENALKALVEFHKKGVSEQMAMKESGHEQVAMKESGCAQVAMKESGCAQVAMKESGCAQVAMKEGGCDQVNINESINEQVEMKEVRGEQVEDKEAENQQVDAKEGENQQVHVTEKESDQVKDQLQDGAQQQKLAQEEDRAHKKRIRVEFGTYRPKIGWGSTDQRQNNERSSQTQKDYQSGQAPMQENQDGRGNEDWSGRAEGAGRRGRGQGGWYRPRPRQRQREWMQHCDR